MNPILAKIDELPIEVRAIIEGDEIVRIIEEISSEFDIPEEWSSDLCRATVQILSGLMHPRDFIPFIEDMYNIERDEAAEVAMRVNERIFSAVKPQLASIHNIEDKKLASRIKVPHKPKPAPIIEEEEEAFYEDISEEIPVQAIKPEPIISLIPPLIIKQTETAVKTPETLLANKLGALRTDSYREPI